MKPLSITTAALLAAFAMQAGAAEPKAVKTPSGIAITTIKDGTGASPKASDTVKVHYRGTLVDGKEFDSSYGRGQPASFPLNRVIPCWTEGVQTMKVGGKAKLLCPPNLAYGSRGVPGTIPPDSSLVFEMLEIAK
jgi:FKBP-type peptidyl-prolyl cis-trans isomerase FkpA